MNVRIQIDFSLSISHTHNVFRLFYILPHVEIIAGKNRDYQPGYIWKFVNIFLKFLKSKQCYLLLSPHSL